MAARVWLAGEEDAESVAGLMAGFRDHMGSRGPSDEDMRATVETLLRDPATEFLLGAAGVDAAPAGVCQLRYRLTVWTGACDCWLEDLFVDAGARRTGLGRALVEAAIERARGPWLQAHRPRRERGQPQCARAVSLDGLQHRAEGRGADALCHAQALDSTADRARRGGSGALSPAIRSSGAESPSEGLRPSGPVRRTEASMAGSRAASAREPGQIREEAALSDTARAPRTSLAGAEDRRARPRTGFDDGCTVHCFARAMGNADLIRKLTDMWNAGEVDGVFDLYTEDAEIRTGPHWPEVAVYRGREEIRRDDRRVGVDVGGPPDRARIDGGVRRAHGAVTGAWRMRGRRQRRGRRDADLHPVHVQGGPDRRARVVRGPRRWPWPPPSRRRG